MTTGIENTIYFYHSRLIKNDKLIWEHFATALQNAVADEMYNVRATDPVCPHCGDTFLVIFFKVKMEHITFNI